ncbi:hypothetical protein RintRC_5540 [Richelia intracellularis]|nr:hypothetical protein RintRC_5540 [Richelia intracellularis]
MYLKKCDRLACFLHTRRGFVSCGSLYHLFRLPFAVAS